MLKELNMEELEFHAGKSKSNTGKALGGALLLANGSEIMEAGGLACGVCPIAAPFLFAWGAAEMIGGIYLISHSRR